MNKLNIQDFSKLNSLENILNSYPKYTIAYIKERFIGLTPIKLKYIKEPDRIFYFRENKCLFESEYKYNYNNLWIDSLVYYELKPHNISDKHLKEIFKLLYNIEVTYINSYSFDSGVFKRQKSLFGTLLNE